MADNCLTLHSLQDDFALNANGDTDRDTATDFADGPYYLVDELGNFLVDELGNFLIAYSVTTVYPQILNSFQDDFVLNAE